MKTFKILSIIFAILTTIIFIGPLLRDVSLASEISDLQKMGSFGSFVLEKGDLPSTSRLYLALLTAFTLTIGCIIGIIFAIKKNTKLQILTYVLFVLIVLTIIIHPSFQMGLRAVSPREIAVIHAIPAFLTALFLFLFQRKLNQ